MSLVALAGDVSCSVFLEASQTTITKESWQIRSEGNKPFEEWLYEEHSGSFEKLRKIASYWEENGIGDQYLVYGKSQVGVEDFSWEMVPVTQTSCFATIWHILTVLFRVVFGGVERSANEIEGKEEERNAIEAHEPIFQERVEEENDPFCNKEVLTKQTLFEGERIRLLYNYAPIGEGEEKLHFLVVSKHHRSRFSDLTEEEYLEAMHVAQKVVHYFCETRPIQDVHLYHKTGRNAGQSVPHWHLHLVFIEHRPETFCEKIYALRRLIWLPSPMHVEELRENVDKFRGELEEVLYEGEENPSIRITGVW